MVTNQLWRNISKFPSLTHISIRFIIYSLVNAFEDARNGKESVSDIKKVKVIIREAAGCHFRVYLLENGSVYGCKPDPQLLRRFDPEFTLYLHEPEQFKGPFYGGLNLKTITTCPPDSSLYHSFLKNGGGKMYVPEWSLSELLSVGKYATAHGLVKTDEHLRALYQPSIEAAIYNRYYQYGGIFRHVFPDSEDSKNHSWAGLQHEIRAIHELNTDAIYSGRATIEVMPGKQPVSDFLLHYVVNDDFTSTQRKLASEYVTSALQETLGQQHIYAIINTARKMNSKRIPFFASTYELLIRFGISHQLFGWQVTPASSSPYKKPSNNDSPAVNRAVPFQFPKLSLEHVFQDVPVLSAGKLYCPIDTHFPIAQLFFATPNEDAGNKLDITAILITSQCDFKHKAVAFFQFWDKIKQHNQDKLSGKLDILVASDPSCSNMIKSFPRSHFILLPTVTHDTEESKFFVAETQEHITLYNQLEEITINYFVLEFAPGNSSITQTNFDLLFSPSLL